MKASCWSKEFISRYCVPTFFAFHNLSRPVVMQRSYGHPLARHDVDEKKQDIMLVRRNFSEDTSLHTSYSLLWLIYCGRAEFAPRYRAVLRGESADPNYHWFGRRVLITWCLLQTRHDTVHTKFALTWESTLLSAWKSDLKTQFASAEWVTLLSSHSRDTVSRKKRIVRSSIMDQIMVQAQQPLVGSCTSLQSLSLPAFISSRSFTSLNSIIIILPYIVHLRVVTHSTQAYILSQLPFSTMHFPTPILVLWIRSLVHLSLAQTW